MGKKRTNKKTLIQDIQEEIRIIEDTYKEIHSNINQLTNRLKKETERALVKKGEHQALRNIEKRLSNNRN